MRYLSNTEFFMLAVFMGFVFYLCPIAAVILGVSLVFVDWYGI